VIGIKIAKDTPLGEITLRRYEKPSDLKDRDLVRKLCLSIGLLQPGDSRDVVVDILMVMLDYRKKAIELSSEEVRDLVVESRKKHSLALSGVASSNVRRQLRRLREVMLVEKVANSYRMTEFLPISEIFDEKVQRHLLSSVLGRVRDYVKHVDERYG
jgi:hypothetical protein